MSSRSMQAAYTIAVIIEFRLSNLKLQKLLYFTHMYYLGQTKTLIDGHFEAWDLGPVEPDVYHLLKACGADNIRNVFPKRLSQVTAENIKISISY